MLLLISKARQMIRMEGHLVHWKKILTHADSLQAWTPKKEKRFHPHGLASLTCLVSMYPHSTFCTPKFTCQGVQKLLVKSSSGHTEGHSRNISMKLFQNMTSSFREDGFLRICSCSYSESSPHSPEPCTWIDQNLTNDF